MPNVPKKRMLASFNAASIVTQKTQPVLGNIKFKTRTQNRSNSNFKFELKRNPSNLAAVVGRERKNSHQGIQNWNFCITLLYRYVSLRKSNSFFFIWGVKNWTLACSNLGRKCKKYVELSAFKWHRNER